MKYQFVGQTETAPKTVTVPEEVKQRVQDKVQWCLDVAKRAHPRLDSVKLPTIRYDKRGTTAGTAHWLKWEINLNSVLLMENLEDMIEDTVPHEIAHLVANAVHGGLIKPHGAEWQSVMRLFGLRPTRCHQYDTTNSKVRTVQRQKVTYICACEQGTKETQLGLTRHRRHQAQGQKRYYCRTCKAYLLKKEE